MRSAVRAPRGVVGRFASSPDVRVRNGRPFSLAFQTARLSIIAGTAQRSRADERGKRIGAVASAATLALATLLLGEHAQRRQRPETQAANAYRTSSTETPVRTYPYVILGSGTAAHAALEVILLEDPSADVLMISEDHLMPRFDAQQPGSVHTSNHESHETSLLESRLSDVFNEWRRQLSSGLLEESEQASTTDLVPGSEAAPGGGALVESMPKKGGVTLLSCERFSDVQINVEDRTISVSSSQSAPRGGNPTPPFRLRYDRCLLATAGKPRELYALSSIADRSMMMFDERVNMLKDVTDFKRLVAMATKNGGASPQNKSHITVVGGGFLGTEVVAALASSRTCNVVHVLGEPSPLAAYVPPYLSREIGRRLGNLGVEAHSEALVTSVRSLGQSVAESTTVLRRGNNNTSTTQFLGGHEGLTVSLVGAAQLSVETDYLVLATTNVKPELVGLDKPGTPLEVHDGGIVTNALFEAYPGLWVAGNAASYYDANIGRRRVDTYDHAMNSGMWAAHVMLQSPFYKRYSHQPSFRSALSGLDLVLHGVGKIDAKLDTVGVFFKPGFDAPRSELAIVTPSSLLAPDVVEEKLPIPVSSQDSMYRRGVVYYLEKGKVVGVLLINAGETLETARAVLESHTVVSSPIEQLPQLILLAPPHWLEVISAPGVR